MNKKATSAFGRYFCHENRCTKDGVAGPAMSGLFSMLGNCDTRAILSAFVQCVGGKQ